MDIERLQVVFPERQQRIVELKNRLAYIEEKSKEEKMTISKGALKGLLENKQVYEEELKKLEEETK